ncbi:MAG: glutathione S-transferase family protein [Emcibacter sp.]|nr:glutathione S-transferase family protein [Emcibacter sp.]
MIELFKFGSVGPVCDPSPFCAKVEAYLKMANLPYETHSGTEHMQNAPKGKLPYIKEDDKLIADSSFIFKYLKEKHGDILDGHLSDEQKATTHAYMKMIDENLYWTIVHSRWQLDHNWIILKDWFFSTLPFPLKLFVPGMVRKSALKGLKSHGMGRHSDAEIAEIGDWDLRALSDLLADKEYFFGDHPSSLDATAYGILAQMYLLKDFTAPIYDKARKYKNLMDYTNRIHDKYFAA